MLATPARDVPAREDEWAAEVKWDGARALAYISGGQAVLRGRSGRDITASYPNRRDPAFSMSIPAHP
ncbi:MAG TPA: hypothetical protein VH478_15270 [Trebonia sp.]|nr:hypothetical protein [Trebonia sp.]